MRRRAVFVAIGLVTACGGGGDPPIDPQVDAAPGTADAAPDVDAAQCPGAECDDLFVATTGTPGACTKVAPCARIGDALALRSASRRRIHVAAGAYRESVMITGTGEVSLIGPDDGLVDLSPDGATSVVTVRGDLRVTLIGFDLHGAGGDVFDPLERNGIVCQLDGRQRPRVVLERVVVRNNPGHGFRALSCDITAERTTFRGNARGGLQVDGEFTVRNSFIVDNGTEDQASSTGGFSVARSPSPGGTFEFNTVAGNWSAGAGAGVNAGTATAAFSNSIVYGNHPIGDVLDGIRETYGGQWSWSIFGGTRIPAGDGNRSADPKFEDPAGGNYYLTGASPALDAADPFATNRIDREGTVRPVAGRCDIGADEFVPPL